MPYIGKGPIDRSLGLNEKDTFTGDGSTVAFDLSTIAPSANAIEVFIDNVRQEPGSGKAYTFGVDGSGDLKRITFSAAPANLAEIYVINSLRTQITETPPDNTITSTKIVGNAVTGAKIADDSIDSEHYAAGSIDNEHLANDAVGADELASNAVVDASIASGAAIDATKIADGSVTSAEFQYINTLSSNAQTQIDAKATKGFSIAMGVALG